MTHRILFVDHDAPALEELQRHLRPAFTFDTALGGPAGLEQLRKGGPYAILVVGMRMPGMDGLEFLERAEPLAPHAVRIMLTGDAGQRTAADAVNRGHVFRFLSKPCPPETLGAALETGLKHFELLQIERESMEGTLTACVKMMSEVLGMVAPGALGRGQRLRDCMHTFALFTKAAPLWELEVAALLSSVGNAALPLHLVQKIESGDRLNPTENEVFRRATQIGHDLLAQIPKLAGVAKIVAYQNKCFDGSGYPRDDVRGAQIPVGARMLKILGDRLALETDGIVKKRALEAMKARTGAYDPHLLDMCFVCFDAFLANLVVADRPVLSLYVSELKAGQVAVSDITTSDGLTLIAAGNRLTEMTLRCLQNHDSLGEITQQVLVQDSVASEAIEVTA